MKYCTNCGAQIADEAVICVHCGCATGRTMPSAQTSDDTLQIIIKIFLIIGCVTLGWTLIPLAWCVPITVSIFNKMRNHEPIGTGLKICTLLFVNLVAGICLLCADDSQL